MNKQEFLETLSEEQLNLLKAITDKDVMQELNKRNLKTSIEVKIGDCFIYINDYDDIYLTKVISYDSSIPYYDGQYFDCEEIEIDSDNIAVYKMKYFLDDFDEYDRTDSEIFDKIAALINTRDNAVDKICKQFDKQIRELCSTLLNTQNKN